MRLIEPARIFPLQVPDWIKYELEASLILYYTGTSRVSAEIIRDQSTNIHRGDSEALTATHALKKEAELMKDCLLNGDMTGIVDTMRTGWLNKKKLALSVSNPQIDTIYASALRAGALAGKVSGAGGGGFMMFLAPPKCRSMVLQALKCFGGEISSCHFETHGSQAWQGLVRTPGACWPEYASRSNGKPVLGAMTGIRKTRTRRLRSICIRWSSGCAPCAKR